MSMSIDDPYEQSQIVTDANTRYYEREDDYTFQQNKYHALRIKLAITELRQRVPRGGRLLDIGPGSAVTPNLAARMVGGSVVAVDMVTRFRAELDASCTLVKANVNRPLPLGDQSFDGIFVGEVIEHLFDPLLLAVECKRLLVPGGSLVLTTPNLVALQDRVSVLFGASPRHVDALHPYLRLHIRPFTSGGIAALLREAGFSEIRCTSNFVVLRIRDRVYLNRPMARYMPSVGGTLIVSARAPGGCSIGK